MMKMKFRIVALALAMLLVLSACEVAPTGSTTPTTQPGQPTQPATDPTLPAVVGSDHRDDNNDEICDHCGIDVTVELDFYSFNDLHGVFMDTAETPGLDEMTTFLKNAYADDSAYEILLSAGDMWQGTVESSSNKGQLMTEWMNHMGFVAMTLGNHEYDWGSQYIAQNAQLAEFPFLGINVTDTNVSEPYCQSSVIVERGGVKIGIIGAVGNVHASISDEFSDGISFAYGKALTQMVKEEAVRLRQEGCQFIVYSIHEGTEKAYPGITDVMGNMGHYDSSLSDGYIDLVFEGHSHYRYIIRDEHGVYHLQASSSNKGLSYAGICYNLVTNTYEVTSVDVLKKDTYADDALADDPIVEDLYSKYFADYDPYTDVLGSNNVRRSSDEIAKAVAEAYLAKGKEVWGEQYNVVLGGARINVRAPYELAVGEVTYAQLFTLLPFDNTVVLCQVTGKQLREKLIGSKNTCAYDANLLSTIKDSELYYIVTDTYTSMYSYNNFTEVARLENTFSRDLLAEFVEDGFWGTAAQEISIAQALEIGQNLKDNESTQQAYQLTGTVSYIKSTTYGNMYIRDEQGNELYLYGLYDATGAQYDAMTNPPQVGDTITVTGVITKYVYPNGGTEIEIISANLQ